MVEWIGPEERRKKYHVIDWAKAEPRIPFIVFKRSMGTD